MPFVRCSMAPSFAQALLRSVREENNSENRTNLSAAKQPSDSVDSVTSPRQKPRKNLSQIIARLSSPLHGIRLPRSSSPLPLLRRSHTQSMAATKPNAPFLEHKHQPPTSILVLSHGLQGTVEDFSYLLETLDSTDEVSSGRILVHASRVNTDKTHDGNDLGGLRLAEDIRHTVAKHSSLQSISLVGFSLRGMYVRYAVAHLYDQQTGKIAGLTADKIVMVASPNLGVRQFGVYRFLQSMIPIAHCLFVQHGEAAAPAG
ncbi:putative lipase ROG1 [Gracilariopsis chorda]|nr:putative lipase ROG1 [Gracilariopsis chorda]|eukprot:PXF39535.1 putative lipase ROG1 [Gracilariopsis chorda]